jgi:ABC-type Fe3+ transport system substrate-binding protein
MRILAVVLSLALGLPLALGLGASAARADAPRLSSVEQIYAELAGLPAAERAKRIEEGARKEGALSIIHGFARSEAVTHTDMFRKRYPFVKIDMSQLGSQDAVERLVSEEAAGRHLTDVVVATVVDFMDAALKPDILARFSTPATGAVLPQYANFKDTQNRWTPWFWSEHGLSYNSNLVPPGKAPKDWFDLCDPFFKDGVSYDPAEVRFLTGLYVMLGEEKSEALLKCLGANGPIISRGHLQRMQLMLAGDHMAQGDNYLYAGLAMKRKNPSVPFAIATAAPVLGYGGATAVNRQAPHPYASALYAEWCLSEESQQYVASILRGPVAIPHPYLAADAKIIAFNDAPRDVLDRMFGYWRKYMEKK